MILLGNFNDYFNEMVNPLSVRDVTKAYVVGVFKSLIKPQEIQMDSIVLAYARACSIGHFESFQELGDWVLWSMTFVPGTHNGHEAIIIDVGRKSYETCWRLLRGQWDVYAELADQFPIIVHGVRSKIRNSAQD